jgi:hypothetical protein
MNRRLVQGQWHYIVANNPSSPLALTLRTLKHDHAVLGSGAAPSFGVLLRQQASEPMAIEMGASDQKAGQHGAASPYKKVTKERW